MPQLKQGSRLTSNPRFAEVASTGRAPIDLSAEPAVLMMVGVNGTGKTTTIGKIAWHLSRETGLSVVMAAADTYRAAAAEQLETWAERAGVPVITRGQGADPGASLISKEGDS